ncbi:MBL fold metallo-hydrolase [Halocatena salina]|uniref:MBL fold metallo-hydrolase n=1 Tax=Halocatena salina TaxID=2934340 RepID=A0A8U0A5V0_9EURY|nr:MBL fold metallo-hydrolase [Halocatena salina]UPM43333.1 MBL fold metallo-hydrolase [Halocatena salina]
MTEITNLAQGEQGFTSNAFLLSGERTVVVDPGSGFDASARIRDHVSDIDAVVLTHTHPDHIGNLSEVKTSFGVSAWGFDTDQAGVDNAIDDGDSVQLGDHTYTALHTPGHKNDHLCFYAAAPGILFAGDLVFAGGSFGRTDLEEGDRKQLIRSIDRVLDTADTSLSEMHTGHGQSVRSDPYRDIQLARQAAEMY